MRVSPQGIALSTARTIQQAPFSRGLGLVPIAGSGMRLRETQVDLCIIRVNALGSFQISQRLVVVPPFPREAGFGQ